MSEHESRPDIEEGAIYDVDVIARGKTDGVARIDNFVIFVPGADIGDSVKIQITRVLDRYALCRRVF